LAGIPFGSDRRRKKETEESQVKLAQEHFLPAVLRLSENNPKVHILVTYGNGDYDGYHYLDTVAQVFNAQYPNLHCIDGKIFQYGRFSFLGLAGPSLILPVRILRRYWIPVIRDSPRRPPFGKVPSDSGKKDGGRAL